MYILFFIVGLSTLQAASFTSLKEIIALRLSIDYSVPAICHFFSNFGLTEDLSGVNYLLAYQRYNFLQYYNALDEAQLGRTEMLIDPRLIGQTELHETLYNPMKFLTNLPIAKAIFAKERVPKPDESFRGSKTFLKSVSVTTNALIERRKFEPGVTIPKLSDFLNDVSKITAMITGKQDEVQYEEIVYRGDFFGRNVPVSYFRQMYLKDCFLTMRMLMFAIDNQMSNMRSTVWLKSLLEVASDSHTELLFNRLLDGEMTWPLLREFRFDTMKQMAYLGIFFDENCSDDVVFVRCAMWALLPTTRKCPQLCTLRFPKVNWRDGQNIHGHMEEFIKGKPPSRSLMHTRLSYKILYGGEPPDQTVSKTIDELIRHKENMLSPMDVGFWLRHLKHLKIPLDGDLDRVERLPDHLKPLDLLPPEQRLDAWAYRGSFRQLLLPSGCDRSAVIVRAKSCTQSPSSLGFSDDYYITLALGFALAEGWKLNLGNVLEAFALKHPSGSSDVGNGFMKGVYLKLGLAGYMDLQELRSFVDSSYTKEP
jgi:hypothetical protein